MIPKSLNDPATTLLSPTTPAQLEKIEVFSPRAIKLQGLDPKDRSFSFDIVQLYPELRLLVSGSYRRNVDPIAVAMQKTDSHPILEETLAALKVSHWALYGRYEDCPLSSNPLSAAEFQELQIFGRFACKQDGVHDAMALGLVIQKLLQDHEGFSDVMIKLGKERVADQKTAFWDALRAKNRDAAPTLLNLTADGGSYVEKLRGVEIDLPRFSRGELLPVALKPIQGLIKDRVGGSCSAQHIGNVSTFLFGQVCSIVGEIALSDATGRLRAGDVTFGEMREAVVALQVMARSAIESPKNIAQNGYDYLLRRAAESSGIEISPARKFYAIANEERRAAARLALMVGADRLGINGGEQVIAAINRLDPKRQKFLMTELNRTGMASLPEVAIGGLKGASKLLRAALVGGIENLPDSVGLLSDLMREGTAQFDNLKGKGAMITIDLSPLAAAASKRPEVLQRGVRLTKAAPLEVSFLPTEPPSVATVKTVAVSKPTAEVKADPQAKTKIELQAVLQLARAQGFLPLGRVVRDHVALWNESERTVAIVEIKLKLGRLAVDHSFLVPNLRFSPEFKETPGATKRSKPEFGIWVNGERKYLFP